MMPRLAEIRRQFQAAFKQALRVLAAVQAHGELGQHADRDDVGRRLLQMRLQQALGNRNIIRVQRCGGTHQGWIGGRMFDVLQIGSRGADAVARRIQRIGQAAPDLWLHGIGSGVMPQPNEAGANAFMFPSRNAHVTPLACRRSIGIRISRCNVLAIGPQCPRFRSYRYCGDRMPIYEFECSACGNVFDRLQKLSDPDPDTCPQCGKKKVHRRVTAPAFRLAGSGWYETDFKKDGEKKHNLVDKGEAPKAEAAKSEPAKSEKPAKESKPKADVKATEKKPAA